jgi:hypothetical protein
MKNMVIILLFVTLTTIGVFFVKDMRSSPTITYFPLEYGTNFKYARTLLTLSNRNEKDHYDITWQVESKTEIPMYIRQDVSLLFSNGELQGMRSKWRENTDSISFTEEIISNTSKKWGYYISFI